VPSDSSSGTSALLEDQYRREICALAAGCTNAATSSPVKAISPFVWMPNALTTPTCVNKGMMAPEDLVIMDMEGTHLQGDRKNLFEAPCIFSFIACARCQRDLP